MDTSFRGIQTTPFARFYCNELAHMPSSLTFLLCFSAAGKVPVPVANYFPRAARDCVGAQVRQQILQSWHPRGQGQCNPVPTCSL